MKPTGRLSSGLTMALVAVGMLLGASRLEAKGGKGGDDGQTAKCAYLLSVITYPNVNLGIKAVATSVYNSLNCVPTL